MKRQWLVAAAVGVVLLAAVLGLLRRGGTPEPETVAGAGERVFVDDSLGVRLRLPESPGWTLRRDPPGRPDGRCATASSADGTATVRLLVLPRTPDTSIEDVFRGRQQQMAPLFGVGDLNAIVAKVVHDETRDLGGRPFRQWQASTRPIEAPGEKPQTVVFMWLMTITPVRAVECLGMARFAVQPTPEETAQAEANLRDMAYILQSFEVR